MKKILFPFLALMLVAVTALTSCSKPQRLFVGGFTGSDGEKAMTVFDFKSNGSLKLRHQPMSDQILHISACGGSDASM